MSRDLVCTFCGSALWVSTRYERGEDRPDAIECFRCYATWKPDGTYLTGGDE